MPESRATARVVHTNPLNLHKLSTDLSFVDNLRPGVQSRSNHYTGCVAQAHPGLPPKFLQVDAADRIQDVYVSRCRRCRHGYGEGRADEARQ